MFSKTVLGGTISLTSFMPQPQPESQQEDHEVVREEQHH